MKYSLTIREKDHESLRASVFSIENTEGAAYLLCGESKTDGERRLLVRSVIPVAPEHYLARRQDFLSLSSASYARVTKIAQREDLSIVFAHSHPGGLLEYSPQDDREEAKLQDFFLSRAPCRLHGSLVLTDDGIIGRVFDHEFIPLRRIRIMGHRFVFHDRVRDHVQNLRFFDRQVRAFGSEAQTLLQSLHIGVVGAGGTGSAVIEQLARLGVGTLSIFDGDRFDASNVNRVYGSHISDIGKAKVQIAKENVERIGLGTKIAVYDEHITRETIAAKLRDCDIIFGCTDKEIPRSILIQMALRYLIPVIDMGVAIKSAESVISDVVGRVTTLMPGEACLFCRQRITAERIRLESLSEGERESLVEEGYAPELEMPNPAVVPFTSAIASLAVTELLHRLTGFMGSERTSSEVLCFFDQARLRTNQTQPQNGCLCTRQSLWGRGDSTPFLDLSWSD